MNMAVKGMSLVLKKECAYSRGCSTKTSSANAASSRLPNSLWVSR